VPLRRGDDIAAALQPCAHFSAELGVEVPVPPAPPPPPPVITTDDVENVEEQSEGIPDSVQSQSEEGLVPDGVPDSVDGGEDGVDPMDTSLDPPPPWSAPLDPAAGAAAAAAAAAVAKLLESPALVVTRRQILPGLLVGLYSC
jgi:hypothetical protein